MGFVAIASLAVTAATTIAQMSQARRAAKAQKEASEISGAGQQIQDRVARRRAIREARVRRAMIENSAAQSGGQGSSGESGALSAVGSTLGASVANQSTQARVSQGISVQNQKAAEAETAFDQIGAFGKLANQGLSMWGDYKEGS